MAKNLTPRRKNEDLSVFYHSPICRYNAGDLGVLRDQGLHVSTSARLAEYPARPGSTGDIREHVLYRHSSPTSNDHGLLKSSQATLPPHRN